MAFEYNTQQKVQQSKKKRFNIILILLITIAIDDMGMGLVFPIISDLFMSSTSLIIPEGASSAFRHLTYGIAMGVWPLGIFLGSAILGKLSDSYGRKKLLILALFGTAIAYILSIFSMVFGNLTLFILSRFLVGGFGGSFAIAQTMILDLTESDEKPKYIGLITLAASIGTVIGPFLTTVLVYFLDGFYGMISPFVAEAILSSIAAILILFLVPDTYIAKKVRLKLLDVIFSFRIIFFDKRTVILAISLLLLQTGWSLYVESLPLILDQHFLISPSGIGLYFTLFSLGFVFANLVLQKILFRKLSLKKIMMSMSLFLSILLMISSLYINLTLTTVVVFLGASFQILFYTALITSISRSVTESEQGVFMGGTNSIFGIAWSVNAIIIGLLVNLSLFAPVFLSSILVAMAGLIFIGRKNLYKSN